VQVGPLSFAGKDALELTSFLGLAFGKARREEVRRSHVLADKVGQHSQRHRAGHRNDGKIDRLRDIQKAGEVLDAQLSDAIDLFGVDLN
jgi:hypothetical protein